MPALATMPSKATISRGCALLQAPAARLAPLRTTRRPIRAFQEEERDRTKEQQRKAGQAEPPQPFRVTDQLQQTPYSAQAAEVFTITDTAMRTIPAFTRRREHFVGRAAMLGVTAMWAGEVLTGLGPMGQLASELHVPIGWAFWATSFLAMGHLLLGLNRGSPTFSPENDRDLSRRSRGWTGITAIEPDTDTGINIFENPGKFLLRSELTLGRTAMLIFAGAMILEFSLGGISPLAHFGYITPGTALGVAPTWLKAAMVVFAAGGLGVFSGFGNNKDPDTY